MKTSSKAKTKFNFTNMVIILLVIIIFVFVYLSLTSKKNDEYKIVLEGNRYITLYQGEEYKEPGYVAFKNEEMVTDLVKVTNEVNVNTPGVYKILYEINNNYEYRYIEIKPLVDYNLVINLDVNTKIKTNRDITIDIKVDGDTFKSLTLPNGDTLNSNMGSYTVSENGTYEFIAINEKDERFTKEIEIDNIDKDAPTGTCQAIVQNKNTIITVNTNESNVIYSYYDNNTRLASTDKNSYTTDNKTTLSIKVILEDEVSNSSEIKCSITDKRYHEPVVPSSNEKIVYHGDSETLKTYIVNRSSYYLTYIWVKDAYTQLNKSQSPEYGTNLYYPRELMNKVSNPGKIMVGFNASGFYLRDTYDASSVSAYSKYDRTSVGTLVITNGQVVRNAYNYAVKTWYTVGVNKDNKLLVFDDLQSNNANEKQAWSQSVISSGIRNTFTFAAPLMKNGVKTNITTSMPGTNNSKKGLQIICQINENNFLLFTSRDETRDKAISEFTKLGCQTAMNFDGGGSIALLYKDKNSNEFKNVIGGNRQLPEVGYFTE